MSKKTRRIRSRKTTATRGKGEYTVYTISIPEEIATKVPEGMRFKIELTEEGILLRPVLPEPSRPIPSWCKDASSPGS